jgi:hypothetical protein
VARRLVGAVVDIALYKLVMATFYHEPAPP